MSLIFRFQWPVLIWAFCGGNLWKNVLVRFNIKLATSQHTNSVLHVPKWVDSYGKEGETEKNCFTQVLTRVFLLQNFWARSAEYDGGHGHLIKHVHQLVILYDFYKYFRKRYKSLDDMTAPFFLLLLQSLYGEYNPQALKLLVYSFTLTSVSWEALKGNFSLRINIQSLLDSTLAIITRNLQEIWTQSCDCNFPMQLFKLQTLNKCLCVRWSY